METIKSLLHGGLLHEPRTWLFVATMIAACVAGWYSGDVLFDHYHKDRDEE